jgi:hypothetical protein
MRIALAILALPLALLAQDPANTFTQVGRYLDREGDFYLFLNSAEVHDEVLELSGLLEDLITAAQDAEDRAQTRRIFSALRHLFAETGLPGIRAVGMSSQRQGKGRFSNRSVIYHGDAPVKGQLWRMTAGPPRTLDGVSLMPDNTVFAFTGDLRLDERWILLSDLADRMGPKTQKILAACARPGANRETTSTRYGQTLAAKSPS